MTRPNPATIHASRMLLDLGDMEREVDVGRPQALSEQERIDWDNIAEITHAFQKMLRVALGACPELGEVQEYAIAVTGDDEHTATHPCCPSCGQDLPVQEDKG